MRTIFKELLFALVPISLLSTVYLYFYPIFHGCAFPSQHAPADASPWSLFRRYTDGKRRTGHDEAPFRLLALGDPQLEGDSSLLNPEDGYFPNVRMLWPDLLDANSTRARLQVIQHVVQELAITDIPRRFQSYRKQLDLLGNDYYLAHIYRTLYQSMKPTHVTVLGDLIGSQWVSDEEFEHRGWRYWQRVFKYGVKIQDDVTSRVQVEPLGQEKSWERRIINIAGNHDLGYAGDITTERVERFERVFGRANWETRFIPIRPNDTDVVNLAELPELKIVVLNSLNLDTPALDEDLQGNTYKFINDVITASRPVEDRSTATILLTHVPLTKGPGVCVDNPYFDFYSEDEGGGLKEQNHLSYNAGKGILEGVFGMSGNPLVPGQGFGRKGIILTGHDHEGCDVYHHLPEEELKEARAWKAKRWSERVVQEAGPVPGIREITVRSMMGEFGGNAGLLSAWFNYEIGEWQFDYSTCSVGTQHIWWAVHIVDIVTVGLLIVLTWTSLGSTKVNKDEKDSALPPSNHLQQDLEQLKTRKSHRLKVPVTYTSAEDLPNGTTRRRKP